MRASLRALLAGVIDYAGLFPPAGLPLEQAIRNYARYRQEPESWMLGRFVCPAARLAELTPFLQEFIPSGPPVALSVVGTGGSSMREFLIGLRDDLEAILSLRNEPGASARVEGYEVRLPAELLAPEKPDELRAVVHGPDAMLAEEGVPFLSSYFEAPPAPDLMLPLGILLGALVEDREHKKGFKLRCGGLEAAAFPPPDDVAFAIAACRETGIPMKFTAGLHHPLRHFDSMLGTRMHGFLNVFGAGVLAHARHLGLEQIRAILEDEDAGNFKFDDDGFHWRDWHATTEEIETARQQAVLSFGSCSFEEPREDLRALRLL